MAPHRRYMITTAKVLSKTEQESLLRVCNRTLDLTREGRNGLVFLIIFECGLRASELLNIKVRDFNFHANQLFIRSLKGSNERELPLRPSRSRALRKFILWHFKVDDLLDVDPDALVFNFTYNRLYQLWAFYRPNKEKGMHSLRHTFAVNLYERTKDIKVVQLALGHRNINNTMVYLDFSYSQSSLRKFMHG